MRGLFPSDCDGTGDIQFFRRRVKCKFLNAGGSLSLGVLRKRSTETCPWDGIKYFYKNETSDEAANMGPEGHASNIVRGETRRKQLQEDPDSEKDKGWNFDELNKEKDEYQCQDLGTGIEEKIGPHDT